MRKDSRKVRKREYTYIHIVVVSGFVFENSIIWKARGELPSAGRSFSKSSCVYVLLVKELVVLFVEDSTLS